MKYRTGTLYSQKHAVWFKHSIRLTCPLCPQLDSALHIFSGRQHTQIRNMITERHNLACSMIFKAISKTGYLGSFFVCMDIGSRERQAMQNLHIPKTGETRIIPKWLIPPRFSENGCQVRCGACLAAVQVRAPSHVTYEGYTRPTSGLLQHKKVGLNSIAFVFLDLDLSHKQTHSFYHKGLAK